MLTHQHPTPSKKKWVEYRSKDPTPVHYVAPIHFMDHEGLEVNEVPKPLFANS